MHLIGQSLDPRKSIGSPDHCTLYIGMEGTERSRTAREEAKLHDPNLTPRSPKPVEGAWQADVVVGRFLNRHRESRALQIALNGHTKASEDSDIVDKMLRADNGDIQVAVSVMSTNGDDPRELEITGTGN
jgi:hypothetical protein